MISLVALARMPSFGSVLPRSKPGLSVSMMKAVTPLCFLLRLGHGEEHDIVGIRGGGDPGFTAVNHIMRPGSFNTARLRIVPASLPLIGSVRL
jgi:hypothetical protein